LSTPPALSLARRCAGVSAAAVLAFVASPGIAGRDGSLVLALASVALWAWTVAHAPGERVWRAWLVEWFGGALVGGLMMWWVVHVVVFGVVYIGAGWGVYFVVLGALVRRLARRFPFPLAVALSWNGVELVRALVPPPFGLGWFRLGYYAHAETWLSGSVRVIGVEGLTFVLAALGGLGAELVRERRLRRAPALAGLAPLVLAVLTARLVPAPATVDGPRVLLVQPGFPQKVKQEQENWQKNLAFSTELTHHAAETLGPVDLACWGESMLPIPIFSPAAVAAIRAGTAHGAPWFPVPSAEDVGAWPDIERGVVRSSILGLDPKPHGALAGASFAVGAEYIELVDGFLRRQVALFLYDSAGQRSAPALKRFLVPLGETFFGLERFTWIRDKAYAAAGYLPDILAAEETGRFALRARDGRTYSLSGTICFDNAHPWSYLDSVRTDPVDFHLVASNEAWYETSCEMDQMVAFSRIYALMTGRSFVRATNSGVSLVLGPDGRELGRVHDEAGADRAIAGFGAWVVPVPAPGASGVPPYVRWNRLSERLWIALLALAAGLAFAGGNRASEGG
jgi:apolipoprotein N-acyltransferase